MDITILNWMQGQSNESLSEVVLNSIAAERNVEDTSADITEISKEKKDLIYADMLVSIYSLPSSFANKDSHNGFDVSRSRSFGKRDNLLSIAISIYKSYGDDKYALYNTISGGTFKTVGITDLY